MTRPLPQIRPVRHAKQRAVAPVRRGPIIGHVVAVDPNDPFRVTVRPTPEGLKILLEMFVRSIRQ